MGRHRPYLEADGGELDCVHFVGESEYVSGFLCLPNASDVGRVRFLEDVPDLASDRSPSLGPVAVTLLDNKGGGTEACLLDSFVRSTRFSAPLQPQFPLTLTVNSVLVGSSDPEHGYGCASLRCPELVAFFDDSEMTPRRAVELGTDGIERITAKTDALGLTLREGVEITDQGVPELRLRWYGELVLAGRSRTLTEWAQLLVEHLCLFAFLCDQPFRPTQIHVDAGPGRVDFYASWPEAAAPRRPRALAVLSEIDDRLDAVFAGWNALLEGAHDLVDHLVDFQLFRERGTAIDQLLSLSRCLELYFDFAPRFDSKYRPTAEHRALVAELTEALSPTYREKHEDWVRSALLNSNRRSVVAQFEAILADLGPDVLTACGIDDASAFAKRAKAARNHYTHPTGPANVGVPEGRDLFIHINRLWFLARGCVLRELGFDNDEIAARLTLSGRRYLLK